MPKKIIKKTHKKDFELDQEKKKIAISRLSALSPNMMFSLGSDGTFTAEELINRIQKNDPVGEKIVEIQLEWIRSFKENIQ